MTNPTFTAVSVRSAAGPFERADQRITYRNGSRAPILTTTGGELDLKIPKLLAGTFFAALLEQRRRIDQALFAVVMEAYLHGVSTRKVGNSVKALGLTRVAGSTRNGVPGRRLAAMPRTLSSRSRDSSESVLSRPALAIATTGWGTVANKIAS